MYIARNRSIIHQPLLNMARNVIHSKKKKKRCARGKNRKRVGVEVGAWLTLAFSRYSSNSLYGSWRCCSLPLPGDDRVGELIVFIAIFDVFFFFYFCFSSSSSYVFYCSCLFHLNHLDNNNWPSGLRWVDIVFLSFRLFRTIDGALFPI